MASPDQTVGPLRPGLIPVKVEYPFDYLPLWANSIKQCARGSHIQPEQRLRIRVRHKRVVPAGSGNIFGMFARR